MSRPYGRVTTEKMEPIGVDAEPSKWGKIVEWSKTTMGIVIISNVYNLILITAIIFMSSSLLSQKTPGDSFECKPPAYMNQGHFIKDRYINASSLMVYAAIGMEFDYSLVGTHMGKCRDFCQQKFNMRNFKCRDINCQVCQVGGVYDEKYISTSSFTGCIKACSSCAQSSCFKGVESFVKEKACGFDCPIFGFSPVKCPG